MGNESSEESSIKRIDKPWGYEELLLEKDGFGFKRLVLKPDVVSSFHFHNEKNEIFYIDKGQTKIRFEDGSEKDYKQGEFLYLPKGTKHQIINTGVENLEILEFGYPYKTEDVVRVEDPWEGKR